MESRSRKSGKGKTKYHHEDPNITRSEEPNSSKTYQPSDQGSKRLRIVGREKIPMPLRNFEYKNSDNIIDHASREESSKEISPAVAYVCKLLGVDPSDLEYTLPELPWHSEEAMIPTSGVPEFTPGTVFSDKNWYF